MWSSFYGLRSGTLMWRLGYMQVRAVFRLRRYGIKLKRSKWRMLRWGLGVPGYYIVDLGQRLLSKQLLLSCEVAMEYLLALTHSPQVQPHPPPIATIVPAVVLAALPERPQLIIHRHALVGIQGKSISSNLRLNAQCPLVSFPPSNRAQLVQATQVETNSTRHVCSDFGGFVERPVGLLAGALVVGA